LKSCCVLQDHYDDERDKVVFHNTTQNLQNQDQDQDRFLGATRSIEPISYGNVSGWLGGWLSVTAGIVSKRLNIS